MVPYIQWPFCVLDEKMNWVRLEQEIAESTPCDKDKYDCTTLFGSFCEPVYAYECRVNLMTGHEKKSGLWDAAC